MKKGFTLVELAIVLVIIGLIMGMAIKGKSLIDVARMRSEVMKISKMEAALSMYVARAGGGSGGAIVLPFKSGTGGVLNVDRLVQLNLVSTGDVKSTMVGTGGMGKEMYDMYLCNTSRTVPASGATPAQNQGFMEVDTSTDVCIVGIGMNRALACSIESLLDNENDLTGNARVWNASPVTSIATAAYLDCIREKDGTALNFAISVM